MQLWPARIARVLPGLIFLITGLLPSLVPGESNLSMDDIEQLPLEILYKYHLELQQLLSAVEYQIEIQNSNLTAKNLTDATHFRVKREHSEEESGLNDSTPSPNNSTLAEVEFTSSEGLNFTEPLLFGPGPLDDESFTNATEPSTTTTTTTTSTTEETIATTSDKTTDSSNSKKTTEYCHMLTQDELVIELKEKGTYNPDFMAWDVPGVIRFLEKTATSTYDRDPKRREDENAAVERNLNALERILRELDVHCDVRSPEVIAKLYNLTYAKHQDREDDFYGEEADRLRTKRGALQDFYQRNKYLHSLYRDDVGVAGSREEKTDKKDDRIGQVHVVPFGCDKRGSEEEDGYLRLCGACQAIRRLPDDYFPPFINEVMCDEDKACLYFYDFPHGKCKQKQMNFVVLRNMGTPECQIWRKFNLNVRVSCECFVDEMSFFAKYV